jgi:hypothetical protein
MRMARVDRLSRGLGEDMTKHALGATLGLVGLAACVIGCTVTTSTTGDDGGNLVFFGDEAGSDARETSTPPDTGTGTPDTGTGADTSKPDVGVAETGPDAGTCSASLVIGSAACDLCMKAQCCGAMVACDMADDAGVDDGGASACVQLLKCTADLCNAMDGGSLRDCLSTCGASYTTSEQNSGTAVISCAETHCSSECH